MENLKISAKNHKKWENLIFYKSVESKHLAKIWDIESHGRKFDGEISVHKNKKLKALPHLGLLQVHISVFNYFYILYSVLINIMGVYRTINTSGFKLLVSNSRSVFMIVSTICSLIKIKFYQPPF